MLAAQTVQTEDPSAGEKDPAGQALQAAAEASPKPDWNFPAVHREHVADNWAPGTAEYLPVPHWVHAWEVAAPSVVEYAPAGH